MKNELNKSDCDACKLVDLLTKIVEEQGIIIKLHEQKGNCPAVIKAIKTPVNLN